MKTLQMTDPFSLRLGAVVKPPAPAPVDIDLSVKWVDNWNIQASDHAHEASPRHEAPAGETFETVEQRCDAIVRAAQINKDYDEPFARTETGAPDMPAAIRGGGVLGGETATGVMLRQQYQDGINRAMREKMIEMANLAAMPLLVVMGSPGELRVSRLAPWDKACTCDHCKDARNASLPYR